MRPFPGNFHAVSITPTEDLALTVQILLRHPTLAAPGVSWVRLYQKKLVHGVKKAPKMEPKWGPGPDFSDFWETLLSCTGACFWLDFQGPGGPGDSPKRKKNTTLENTTLKTHILKLSKREWCPARSRWGSGCALFGESGAQQGLLGGPVSVFFCTFLCVF